MKGRSILITGLCMQGNKGGPALALSIRDALVSIKPDSTVVFSVSNGVEFEVESRWAGRFRLAVVPRVSLKHYVWPFSQSQRRREELVAFSSAARAADVLVNMSAISYVGPPSLKGDLREALASQRLVDIWCSFRYRKRLEAWTQSYGPFSTRLLKVLGRLDLRRRSVIYCRGEDALRRVKDLLPEANAVSYPDTAISLEFEPKSRTAITGLSPAVSYVTISPSSVLYSRGQGTDEQNSHILTVRHLISEFRRRGLHVVLVPHTVKPTEGPRNCDLEVARLAFAENDEGVTILSGDFGPRELKSAISGAVIHVGARYHSLVASLSAGIPSIALSWHPKYRDLMGEYGQQAFIVEESNMSSLLEVVGVLLEQGEAIRPELQVRQEWLQSQVIENARQFIEMIES